MKKTRVLIVDDSAVIRQVLKRLLSPTLNWKCWQLQEILILPFQKLQKKFLM
ncbi:hypothetical protein MYP_4873 [Sporocytophaga myxococcoides]|uniref:Response regulatory domain-containing protein n=1 Tax=Sporocytophaga myxococcoides TaxID=153721 RepID=A0A098LNE6_9BACT|nr:hypothetical protein [Sporocytophaga myxococcoides]GAL87643.1 hypothetical protein MYP_4873 [Sporocytophaga myxococcoides]